MKLGDSPSDAVFRARVETLFLSMSYIVIFRWNEHCSFAKSNGVPWPLLASQNASLTQWQKAMAALGVSQVGPGHGFTAASLSSEDMYKSFLQGKDCVVSPSEPQAGARRTKADDEQCPFCPARKTAKSSCR